VMNTDNMTISGETIDYGPCAFMEVDHPDTVFSSIDRGGRYAWGRQPAIAQWNLARRARLGVDVGTQHAARLHRERHAWCINHPARHQAHWRDGARRKLGLSALPSEDAADEALAHAFLEALQAVEADYSLAFRALLHAAAGEPWFDDLPALPRTPAMDDWLARWRARLARDPMPREARVAMMRTANPAVIPRNHRIEAAIAAAQGGDFAPFEALLAAVRRPFDDDGAQRGFMAPPTAGERVLQTFCGT